MAVFGIAAFFIWGFTPAQPMPEALADLQSDSAVQVAEQSRWISFTPLAAQPERGLVFYPGGRIDARAYAPAAHALAERGIQVMIVKMPLDLAVLAPGSAAKVIEAFPDIRIWAIGGHALGGVMAASYTLKHPDQIKGLLLWAAYPANNASLAATSVSTLVINASQDGLVTPEEVDDARALLSANTMWHTIEGGNHAHFGWYGEQVGDLTADISREEQQRQLVEASAAFILGLTP